MKKETFEQTAQRLAKEHHQMAEAGKRYFMNYNEEDKELQNTVIQILVNKYNYRLEASIIVTKPPFENI